MAVTLGPSKPHKVLDINLQIIHSNRLHLTLPSIAVAHQRALLFLVVSEAWRHYEASAHLWIKVFVSFPPPVNDRVREPGHEHTPATDQQRDDKATRGGTIGQAGTTAARTRLRGFI